MAKRNGKAVVKYTGPSIVDGGNMPVDGKQVPVVKVALVNTKGALTGYSPVLGGAPTGVTQAAWIAALRDKGGRPFAALRSLCPASLKGKAKTAWVESRQAKLAPVAQSIQGGLYTGLVSQGYMAGGVRFGKTGNAKFTLTAPRADKVTVQSLRDQLASVNAQLAAAKAELTRAQQQPSK